MHNACRWCLQRRGFFMLTGDGLRKQKIADRVEEMRRKRELAIAKLQNSNKAASQKREDLEVWKIICRVCLSPSPNTITCLHSPSLTTQQTGDLKKVPKIIHTDGKKESRTKDCDCHTYTHHTLTQLMCVCADIHKTNTHLTHSHTS